MRTLLCPPYTEVKKNMITAAHAAGKILLEYQKRNIHVREKINAGLVSDADTAAERAVIKILKKCRPDFDILAEESAPQSGPSQGGRWIIDPLDGTTNYVHGFPWFCVSIAAEWQGRIIAGVIYQPVLEDTYFTYQGRGAFLNGKRIHVSKTRNIESALLATGFAYRKSEYLKKEVTTFERMSTAVGAIRRPGSAALDLAYVARGVFDGYWEHGLSPWDVAAGKLLVEEAGGKITDFKGKPLNIHLRETLAANPHIHRPMLKIIQST